MYWDARAIAMDGRLLPSVLLDGHVELRNVTYRDAFKSAFNRVIEYSGFCDSGLTHGSVCTLGAGRVLSLLAGNGGSLGNMDKFSLPQVIDMSHAVDLVNCDYAVRQMINMGVEGPSYENYYWSAVEFIATCAGLGLEVECHRR